MKIVGSTSWARPAGQLAMIKKAGLPAQRHEFFTYHVHAHLDVFINGHPVTVPAGLGINISDPGVVHDGTSRSPTYGGISECVKPCISPLHTHDTSGVIHTESQQVHSYHLGQFFAEWGVRLDASCVGPYCLPHDPVAVFVDGRMLRLLSYAGAIRLTSHKEIAVVIGSPPKNIPSSYSGFAGTGP